MTKSKLTGGGNTTSAVLKYIHTYEGTKGSIDISATSDSIGGSVSLSGVDKQWSIVANIPQLKY